MHRERNLSISGIWIKRQVYEKADRSLRPQPSSHIDVDGNTGCVSMGSWLYDHMAGKWNFFSGRKSPGPLYILGRESFLPDQYSYGQSDADSCRFMVQRKKARQGGFFGLSPLWLFLLAVAGLALQLLSGLYLRLVFAVFPEWLRYYTYVLENLGMTEPTFLPLLYTIVLAPVTEELIFRGLSLKILEMEFPFWAANILQAFYFGTMHGNMVQGIYAFLSGMVLGYLVKRKGTLAAGILCHFGVNLSGVLLGLL